MYIQAWRKFSSGQIWPNEVTISYFGPLLIQISRNFSKRDIGRRLQELQALFGYRLIHLTFISSVRAELAAVPNKL